MKSEELWYKFVCRRGKHIKARKVGRTGLTLLVIHGRIRFSVNAEMRSLFGAQTVVEIKNTQSISAAMACYGAAGKGFINILKSTLNESGFCGLNHFWCSSSIGYENLVKVRGIKVVYNMGVAGIPWWTSDIGGFLGGNIQDEAFRELLVRWFAWSCFCPVFRMHGERSPWYEREEEFINNVRQLTSGQDNEVWSFGEENYEILKKFLFIRERLRPYVRDCMKNASETGAPVMRPVFFDFPADEMAWNVEDAYMFGPDLLVAPVMEAGATERSVYLPAGCQWTDACTKQVYKGGQFVTVPTPMDVIPVFFREGASYDIY